MNKPLHRTLLPYSQLNITFILIGINVFVFILTSFSREVASYMAMNPMNVVYGKAYWQVFTYMFVHGSIMHILFNMLGLFIFGYQIERQLGSWEFLFFYLLIGVLVGVASLPFYWFTGQQKVFLMGASGAVYGVLLAFATFFPTAKIYLYGLIPVKAPFLIIGFTLWGVYNQIFARSSGISHFGHLMGFAFAYIYFLVRIGVNPINRFFPPK